MDLGPELEAALQQRLNAAYCDGLRDGLAVAEKIIGWLSRKPDRQWQADVRGWAENAVAEAKRSKVCRSI